MYSVLGARSAERLRIFFQLLEVGFRPSITTGHAPVGVQRYSFDSQRVTDFGVNLLHKVPCSIYDLTTQSQRAHAKENSCRFASLQELYITNGKTRYNVIILPLAVLCDCLYESHNRTFFMAPIFKDPQTTNKKTYSENVSETMLKSDGW